MLLGNHIRRQDFVDKAEIICMIDDMNKQILRSDSSTAIIMDLCRQVNRCRFNIKETNLHETVSKKTTPNPIYNGHMHGHIKYVRF